MAYVPLKILSRFWTVLALLPLLSTGEAAAGTFRIPAPAGSIVSKIPFIANEGQLSSEVAFYTRTLGATVMVTRDGGILYAPDEEGAPVYRESFTGSLKNDVREGSQAEALLNYYQGAERSRWRESVKTFRNIRFGSVYENIEVELHARHGTVEKVFTVYPGGDVSEIRCRIEGGQGMNLSDSGHLTVLSPAGRLRFTPPAAYQVKGSRRHEISVSYELRGSEYGFLTGEYDKTLPLVIDPLLASTYMGGKSNETAYALEISGGDIVLAGTADSKDIPGTDGRIDPLGDSFVVRLDTDLSTVRAATFFGGSMTDGVRAMVLAGGSIYAAGYNNSPNFPTTPSAAYAGTALTGAFIVRMDSASLRITSSTSFYSNVFGLAWSPVDGSVFVAGSTGDTGFPIPSGDIPAFQSTHRGGAESFVAVFDENLEKLKGATLLGGEGFDIIYDLTVDDDGYPVAVGITNSAAFPASENSFDPTYNLDWEAAHQWIDGFVARFSPDLGSLPSATYLGGGLIDNVTAVAAEGGLVLVGGNTASPDFPCASTFGPVDGNDAFVVLLDKDLSRVRSCTVFGGSRAGTDSPESVSDVGFHPSGSIFAVGRTNADDFPTTPGAFLPHPAGSYFGAFVIGFNRDMSMVQASTLVSGTGEDIKAVAFDSWGDVVVAGDISGSSYPVTPGALQAEYAGGDDLVISRFTSDLTGPHIEVVPGTLNFDSVPVGTSKQVEIILYNTGGSELVIDDVNITAGSAQAFDFDNQCHYIPAFGSCSMKAFFKPVLLGAMKGEIVVYSNDPFRGQVVVGLEGRGLQASSEGTGDDHAVTVTSVSYPRIEAGPDPCDFGKVHKGVSVLRTVTVSNTGRGDLYLDRVVLESGRAGPFMIEKDTCSGNVLTGADPDSRCEVQIVFTPEREGDAGTRLRFSSSDPLNAVYAVLLKGTGIRKKRSLYPGFWGWVAILILILRMLLGFPVSASGWRRWLGGKNSGKWK